MLLNAGKHFILIRVAVDPGPILDLIQEYPRRDVSP